jgi:hypothetical protein
MKRIILSTLASLGFAACTTSPTYTAKTIEPRNPSSFADVSEASANSVGSALAGSSQVSINVSESGLNESKKISEGLWDILKGSASASKDVAIIGWGASKESSAIVVASANEVSRLAIGAGKFVVTTSGHIFEASVDASNSAIGVSVDVANGVSHAVVRVGSFILGEVQLSAAAASDISAWSVNKSADGIRWSVNSSGELLTGSGKVIGYVVDTSGRVIHFALDKSGKLLRISGDASVAVIHGSSDAVSTSAQAAKNGLKASAKFVAATITVSAQGSLVVLNWSVDGSRASSRFVTNSLKHLLYAAPEKRPTAPTAPDAY